MSTDAVPMSLSARLRVRRHGFTLLELVVVLIVLAVLSLIAVPTYSAVKDRARDAAKEVELNAIMRDALAIAKSRGASYPTQAEVDTAANEAQLQSDGVFAAVDGLGDRDSLIDTNYPDAGWQYLIDYGPSIDPTVVSYAYDGSVATNFTLGWAMRSTSGHCVFGRSEGTSTIETWIVGEDLGAGCAGTPGLEGPSGTFVSIPTTTTTTTAPNNPPVAVDDTYNATAGVELAEPADGVLANDTDADVGDTLTVISNTDPAHGSIAVATDGSFTYTADLAYAGDDTFDYTISDGNTGTATATVTITVAPALGIWNPDAVDVVTVAGDGTYASSDNSDPLAASFKSLYAGTALNGVIYIPEPSAKKVRSYNPSTGAVETAAGNGSNSCSSSSMKGPIALATDGTSLFLADSGCGIRSIDTSTGTITTVSSSYLYPQTLVFGGGYLWTTDAASTLYRVDPSTGATTSVTSSTTGVTGYYAITGDDTHLWIGDSTSRLYKVAYADALTGTVAGGQYIPLDLSSANLSNYNPLASAGDYLYAAGTAVFAESVVRIDKASGELVRITGTGFAGFADGHGYAAEFKSPHVFTADGKLYVGDSGNYRLRRIDVSLRVDGDVAAAFSQTVTLTPDAVDVVTAAGDGASGFIDSAAPLTAEFRSPRAGVVLNGVAYTPDPSNSRIRTYDLTTGEVSTLTGDGSSTCDVDSIQNPYDLATDDVRLYIADGSCGVYQLDPATGIFARITTTPTSGGLVYGPDDHLWAANGSSTLYRIDIFSGVVETITASTTGVTGYYRIAGDATYLWIGDSPSRLYKVAYADALTGTVSGGQYIPLDLPTPSLLNYAPFTSAGNYLYATGNGAFNESVIRIDKASGELVRITGTGFAGFADGHGYAAQFNSPQAFTTGTAIYVSDRYNYRLRRIDSSLRVNGGVPAAASSTVTLEPDAVDVATAAGNGTSGFIDSATPLTAEFRSPRAGVVLNGVAYTPDPSNSRIRTYDLTTGEVGTIAGDGSSTCDVDSIQNPYDLATDDVRLYIEDSVCGVYQLDPATGIFARITTTPTSGGLVYGPDDHLWTANGSSTLYRIDIFSGVVETITASTTGVTGYYRIAGDATYLWIGDSPSRLYKVAYADALTGTVSGGQYIPLDLPTPSLLNYAPFTSAGNYLYATGNGAFNESVIRIDKASGELVRITGTGFAGFADGHGYAAQFNSPQAFTTGTAIYISEIYNYRLRSIDPATRPAPVAYADPGVVRDPDAVNVVTVAGDGTSGFADSAAPLTAKFSAPHAGVVLSGVAYIPDASNHRIRTYDLTSGAVGTMAGDGSNVCDVDSFKDPYALATDGVRLYVADASCGVYQLDPASGVFALITNAVKPANLTYGSDGNLYAGYSGNLAQINLSTGEVTTVANATLGGLVGSIYQTAADADYVYLLGSGGIWKVAYANVTTGPALGVWAVTTNINTSAPFVFSGGYIYMTGSQDFDHSIVRLDLTGLPKLQRITGTGFPGYRDGHGYAAQFNSPELLIGGGDMYVVDRYNYRIRRVDVEARVNGTLDPAATTTVTYGADAATVVTVAGDGTSGFVDSANPLTAEFSGVHSPAAVLNGIAYIPDAGNHKIRTYNLTTGEVGTLAGDGSNVCDVDSFKNPYAVTTDGVRLYVADASCGMYQLDPTSGVFARLTTNYMVSSITYATAPDFGMTNPVGEMGVLFISNDNFNGVDAPMLQYLFSDVVQWFIPDPGGSGVPADPLYGKTIYHVVADGTYLWMSASDGLYRSVSGSQNGAYISTVKIADATGWSPSYPIASAGNYIYAASSSEVYRITKSGGAIVRVAGSGIAGWADGTGPAAQFNSPYVFVGNGHVYVSDTYSYRIRRLD